MEQGPKRQELKNNETAELLRLELEAAISEITQVLDAVEAKGEVKDDLFKAAQKFRNKVAKVENSLFIPEK